MAPLMINLAKNKFLNIDSADRLIRYITRTRPNEDRRNELLAYGFNFGNAYDKPIADVIHEMEYVQKIYHATGCLMCHYTMQVSEKDCALMDNDLKRLCMFGSEACNYLFNLGHQACYAIHYSQSEKLHLHFAINTVNCITGKKLRQHHKEISRTVEYPIKDLFSKHCHLNDQLILD